MAASDQTHEASTKYLRCSPTRRSTCVASAIPENEASTQYAAAHKSATGCWRFIRWTPTEALRLGQALAGSIQPENSTISHALTAVLVTSAARFSKSGAAAAGNLP